jgi:RNA polymerase sigma-70 factor, ECF subfamily
LDVDPDEVARRFGERLSSGPDGVHATDFYLAVACAGGDPRALEKFEEVFLCEVGKHIARIDPSREFADEVKQLLRVKLFVSAGNAPPKIREYSGRGALGAWLRVAAIRAARDLIASRRVHSSLPESGPRLRSNGSDPELTYLMKHYGSELGEALRQLLASLPARDRNVLSLYFREGLSSSAIGALYGVQGATVRLWIKQCRESLLSKTRQALGDRLGLQARELESVAAMLRSQLDLSLSRVLAAPELSPEKL